MFHYCACLSFLPLICTSHTPSTIPHTPAILKNIILSVGSGFHMSKVTMIPICRTMADHTVNSLPVSFMMYPVNMADIEWVTPYTIITYPIFEMPHAHDTQAQNRMLLFIRLCIHCHFLTFCHSISTLQNNKCMTHAWHMLDMDNAKEEENTPSYKLQVLDVFINVWSRSLALPRQIRVYLYLQFI